MKSFNLSLATILLLFLLGGCATISYNPARWDPNRFIENQDIFWKEGTQFLIKEKDSVLVTINGALTQNNNAYIFVSISNNSSKTIHFYPYRSKIIIDNKKKTELRPLKPSVIRKTISSESSFFSVLYATSVIANSYAMANSKSILSKSYYESQAEKSQTRHYALQEQLRQKETSTIDILIKNNDILPDEYYSGCLLFSRSLSIDEPFDLILNVNDIIFKVRGKFCDGTDYDEYDLPEDIKLISFDEEEN